MKFVRFLTDKARIGAVKGDGIVDLVEAGSPWTTIQAIIEAGEPALAELRCLVDSATVRSAFWIGQPREGHADAFEAAVNDELAPALRSLPGVRDARPLWPKRREDEPPMIACQMIVEFASHSDLERMLASPERLALRARVREVAAIFDGTLSHIDYEVGGASAA